MSSAEAQIAYQTGNDMIPLPLEAQEHFARQYDLSNPDKAMSSYQKIMHEHTKQQFDIATASSRRRSGNSDMVSLTSESSTGSRSSTGS